MRIYAYSPLVSLVLVACGGSSSTPAPGQADAGANAVLPALSAKPLADNKFELSINTGQAGRWCVRQDSVQPLPGDSCFGDADSLLKVQQKTLASPSATQRATFRAWQLSANTVSLLGSVSVPGKTCSAAAYTAASASSLPTVCVVTDYGDSVLALEPVKAPITVANFLRYVNRGFYDQTVFHRFLKSGALVVQGGGYTYSNGSYVIKDPEQQPIVLEAPLSTGLSNTAGTVAMARTNDPDSATAGFFVNTAANLGFDGSNSRTGYAVFGAFVYGAATWTTLLNAVAGSGEVIQPTPPVALQWLYQIQ